MSSVHVGLDLSKKSIVLATASSPQQAHFSVYTFDNDHKGISELELWLAQHSPASLVFEASGGYEELVRRALEHHPTLRVSMANPRRAKQLLQGLGHTSKTDAQDAQGLARVASLQVLPVLTARSDSQLELRELMDYRAQRVDELSMRKMQRDKLRSESLINLHDTLIKELSQTIKTLDAQIQDVIRGDEDMKRKKLLIEQVPGMGPVVSATLLAYVPELGKLSNRELSALVGVAPMANDSGAKQGIRHTRPGRKQVKRVLWISSGFAHKVEGWQHFEERLTRKEKPRKVVRMALMRKMLCTVNAMIAQDQDFDPSKLLAS